METENKKGMKVSVKVVAQDGSRFYRGIITTYDPRQVWNEIERGRRAVGVMVEKITTVALEGDNQAFRIGNEKDTVTWLTSRFNEAKLKNTSEVKE